MVWRCACDLDIIPRLIFFYFFRILNLVIFQARILSKAIDSGYIVCAIPPTVLYRSFWNFTDVFVMVWRCACGLDIIHRLIFVTFFRILNLVIFQSWILLKCIDSGYLVCATPPAVLCQSFSNFTGVLVMVWRYTCGLDIILRSFRFSLLIFHIAKKKYMAGDINSLNLLVSLILNRVSRKVGRERDIPERIHLTTRKQTLACLTWPERGSNQQRWDDERLRPLKISGLNHSATHHASCLNG